MSEQSHPGSTSTVPTWLASLPILSLIGLLALNVWIWGSDAALMMLAPSRQKQITLPVRVRASD
ncbi:MAG: hypothetical protein ACK5D7_00885, partial [Planctomycetota bacterium]